MEDKPKGGGKVNHVDIQRQRKQRVKMHTNKVGWNVQGLLSETMEENINNAKEVPKDLVASVNSFLFNLEYDKKQFKGYEQIDMI